RQRKARKQQIVNKVQQQKSRKRSIFLIPILFGIACIILTFFTVHSIADAFFLTKYVPVSQTSTTTSSVQIEHDDNGNITSAPSPKNGTIQKITYDAWNRPVKVRDENGNIIVEYEYNGLGQRIATIANGVRTEHHYNENWQELESHTGTEVTTHVWGQRHLDDLVYREQNGQRLYSLPDPNWNVVATANPAGVVQERINYSAFGNPTFHAQDMTPKTTSDFAWNRTFTGQTYDQQTGMMHYRRRDYDPAMGRFTNRDPIEYEAEDVNLYRYVGNKSPNATDAQGEMFDSISVAIRSCMQLPTYAQRLTCLEKLLGSLGESGYCNADKIKKITDTINKLKNTPVRDLIRGTFKKDKGYASELENMTLEQIKKLAQGKGPLAEKARRMQKFVEESKRLAEQQGGKP
ncbi:MAG: hypothetical protein LBE12_17885, partial [Planctomycetaceae bacterium]|nr:hypothetical protein [Planctomycetaceae bacterium]